MTALFHFLSTSKWEPLFLVWLALNARANILLWSMEKQNNSGLWTPNRKSLSFATLLTDSKANLSTFFENECFVNETNQRSLSRDSLEVNIGKIRSGIVSEQSFRKMFETWRLSPHTLETHLSRRWLMQVAWRLNCFCSTAAILFPAGRWTHNLPLAKKPCAWVLCKNQGNDLVAASFHCPDKDWEGSKLSLIFSVVSQFCALWRCDHILCHFFLVDDFVSLPYCQLTLTVGNTLKFFVHFLMGLPKIIFHAFTQIGQRLLRTEVWSLAHERIAPTYLVDLQNSTING